MLRLIILVGSAIALASPAIALGSDRKETDSTIIVTGEPAQTGSSKDPNEVVCRRYVETGSLAKKRKICKTRKQWSRAGEDARNQTGEAQLRGLGTSGADPTIAPQ